MKKIELLDKMELIDPEYVVEAEAAGGARSGKRRLRPVGLAAAAACLCLLVVGAALLLPRLTQQPTGPSEPSIAPFEGTRTTAKVTFEYDGQFSGVGQMSLIAVSEEEALNDERNAVFRGTVSSLTNVTVDYNGEKEYYCVAEIAVSRVYRGELTAGETVKMLLPCPIDVAEGTQPYDGEQEDGVTKHYIKGVGTISRLRCGMEGIFISRLLDEDSYIEKNGATLVTCELAQCRLDLGGWEFLDTEDGLKFNRNRYIGARYATSLDEIEEYVMGMIK